MKAEDIVFTQAKATVFDIYKHLIFCSDLFIPPLDNIVNIRDYSDKIKFNAITFEAWVQNQLVGLVACYFNDLDKKQGFITNVSVLSNFKGMGIAKGLLNLCFTYADQHQFNEVSLEVNLFNFPAIDLYTKMGFEVVDVKGKSQIMTKLLNT